MTKITFYRNEKKDIVKYIFDGHTGYDVHGSDIVCSAMSVLALAGFNALEEICKIDVKHEIDDGYLEVSLPENLSDSKRHDANIVLNTIELGVQSTKESYPDYITLKYGEV